MANRRLDPVTYRPFRPEPLLSEGLLSVSREGGELERKVAIGMARVADTFADRADRQAERAGALAGRRAAYEGRPTTATVTGGDTGVVTARGVASSGTKARPGNTAAAYARDYLMEKHAFSPIAAAAVAGHGMQESGFNLNAVGDHGTAAGAFQWRGNRLANLKRFAQEQGKDWQDLDTQLDFTVRELNTSEALAGRALGEAVTLEDAVSAFMHFERPQGYTAGNPSAGHGYQSRLAYARGLAGAGGAYSRIPKSSVAPTSVTEIRTPVSVTPGKSGSFRPTGRDTIYGRAYDVQGERTYLEELDFTMREDQAAVYEAYKDDPEQLSKALDQLETAHQRESVYEEIGVEYSQRFREGKARLVHRAEAERDKRREEQNRVDFLDRVGSYEDRKAQALAALDPNDPASEAAVADLQGSIDAHYDSAVARGVLSPAEADIAKRRSRSEMTVGFYLKQADNRSADEIASMRAEMTKDFAAGALDGVTADDWDKIDRGLAASWRARRTRDLQADKSLVARGNALAAKIAAGQPVTADEVARFQLDAGTAPNGAKTVQSTLARMQVADAIRKLPIGDVEKRLPDLVKGADGSTDVADLAFGREAIARQKKELAADPLGVAERFGVIAPAEALPIGAGVTVADAEAAFAGRMATAEAAADHFGVAPRYFRPAEVEEIKGLIDTDPDAALSIAAGVVSSAGPKAGRILGELGEKAPGLDQAGSVLVLGGNADAARDLIAGYGKTPEGKNYPDFPVTKRRPVADDVLGSSLAFDQQLARKFEAGAAAIARKRLYDAGIDPKSEDSKGIYARALNEAAGAVFVGDRQFGGFASYDPGFFRGPARQVVVPNTIEADRFVDVVGALTDADLGGVTGKNGKPWRAADFQNAVPVRVEGGHVFALGDPSSSTPMFISDAGGRPIVLDFEGALGKALAARVPEAFR